MNRITLVLLAVLLALGGGFGAWAFHQHKRATAQAIELDSLRTALKQTEKQIEVKDHALQERETSLNDALQRLKNAQNKLKGVDAISKAWLDSCVPAGVVTGLCDAAGSCVSEGTGSPVTPDPGTCASGQAIVELVHNLRSALSAANADKAAIREIIFSEK